MINKSAASTGRAFDVSIKRERSASIGCAGLTRLQRCREIQQFLFAYPGSLRSLTRTGSGSACSCHRKSHPQVALALIIA